MARFIITDGSGQQRTFELTDHITVVGRSSETPIHIEDKQCSRRHCHFERTDYGFKLVDLESRNGTRVNDKVVNQALLRPGDRVTIGKHTLTFEDTTFKEPPAEVAARFAPPTSAPAPVNPSGLPVATAVAEPQKAPQPAVVDAGPEPRLRRRTGHTTAIERTARYERAKEQKLLTYVGVGAGVFVFILLVLILIPSGGGEPSGNKTAREAYEKGLALYQQRQFDQARIALDRVPAQPADIKAKALGLLRQIEDDQKRMGAAAGDEEKKAFDELYDFCEKHRANPNTYERMYGMCQGFRDKYPKSQFSGKVDEYIAVASAGRKATVKNDLTEGERLVQEDVKKNDFASGVRRLKELMNRHKDDAETHQRLGNVLGEIQDKAKLYSRAEKQKADEFLSRGKRDEAQLVYQALIVSMGDGTVPELEDYANLAKTALQGLK